MYRLNISPHWHFPAFNVLNLGITNYDGNWELPVVASTVVQCITFSLSLEFYMFWVAVLIAFGSAVTFLFGESVLVFRESVRAFPLTVGFSSVSNGEWRFLVSVCCITPDGIFFKGDLTTLDSPGFAGISSCQILLFSVCITSLFCLCNYFCWLELVIKWLVFLAVLLIQYSAAIKGSISFCFLVISKSFLWSISLFILFVVLINSFY